MNQELFSLEMIKKELTLKLQRVERREADLKARVDAIAEAERLNAIDAKDSLERLFEETQEKLIAVRLKGEADLADDLKEGQRILALFSSTQAKKLETKAQRLLEDGLVEAIAIIQELEASLIKAKSEAPKEQARREAKLVLKVEALEHDIRVLKALRGIDKEVYASPVNAPALVEFVYIISDGQYHKVGFSSDPYSRLAALQTGNPRQLKLVAMFPTSSGKSLENLIHSQLTPYRLTGEWFEAPISQILSVVSRSLFPS